MDRHTGTPHFSNRGTPEKFMASPDWNRPWR